MLVALIAVSNEYVPRLTPASLRCSCYGRFREQVTSSLVQSAYGVNTDWTLYKSMIRTSRDVWMRALLTLCVSSSCSRPRGAEPDLDLAAERLRERISLHFLVMRSDG